MKNNSPSCGFRIGEGTFYFEPGRGLVFENLWLGTHNRPTKQPVKKGCGHRFN